MKPIDLSEKRAMKNGEATPLAVVKELLEAIERGEVKHVVCVTHEADDTTTVSYSDNVQTATLGLLECGKQLIINDMFDL